MFCHFLWTQLITQHWSVCKGFCADVCVVQTQISVGSECSVFEEIVGHRRGASSDDRNGHSTGLWLVKGRGRAQIIQHFTVTFLWESEQGWTMSSAMGDLKVTEGTRRVLEHGTRSGAVFIVVCFDFLCWRKRDNGEKLAIHKNMFHSDFLDWFYGKKNKMKINSLKKNIFFGLTL